MHTQTEAAKKSKKNGKATPGDYRRVTLRLGDVVIEDAWNSRDLEAMGSGAPKEGATDGPAHELSDDELRYSIQSQGLLQPCGVRPMPTAAEGGFHLVWGFRRARAALSVFGPDRELEFCVADVDDYGALNLNLLENLQRRNLKPYEIAKTLDRMKRARPERTVRELAADVGLSYPYVSNLVRIATKAHPTLWDLFMHFGCNFSQGITYKDFVSIVRLPKDEQLEAWEALLAERQGKVDARGGKTRARKRPTDKALTNYLGAIEDMPAPPAFRQGVTFGIQVAMGERGWTQRAWRAPKPSKRKASKPKRKASKRKAKKGGR